MRLIDAGSSDPRENLVADDNVVRAMEATGTGETLRLWESPMPAVIIGRSGHIAHEVHEASCARDRIPILRRQSGGGAVVVASGCLNYSLVLSLDARQELRGVTRSYALILGQIVKALALSGLRVRGVSDLAILGGPGGGRQPALKVGGSAQYRGRRTLLHHGTLLYGLDANLLTRYLKEPARQPAYRAHRGHAVFVSNLPLSLGAIKARLIDAWSAH